MSETNNSNTPLVVKFELPQVVNEAFTPLATAIGDTLATGWRGLTIGVDTWYSKKRIEHDVNLAEYQNAIQSGLSSIPQENLQEPKMSILGPSLEASKYFFEEEQYREMFSKLIAHTCDNRMNKHIHSCFVEFIKQMDPKDAALLKTFVANSQYPIVEYRLKLEKGFSTILTNSLLIDGFDSNLSANCSSITNLERLGLVKISYENFLTNSDVYIRYENHPEYNLLKEVHQNHPAVKSVTFEKGVVTLTPLGEDFIKVCVE